MTKEVTSTTVKSARIEVQNGLPTAIELEPIILLGNVDVEQAQKKVTKQYGAGVTVLEVEANTELYELEVEKFIQIARLRETPLTEEEKAAETESEKESVQQ